MHIEKISPEAVYAVRGRLTYLLPLLTARLTSQCLTVTAIRRTDIQRD